MQKKALIFILTLISFIPFRIFYLLSDIAGYLLCNILKYRKKVVLDNLVTSFPDKHPDEIKLIAKDFYRYISDIMIETIKLLSISEKSLKKRFKVVNPEIVNSKLLEGRSTVILLGHYGNWEWVQEIGTYFTDKSFKGSIYHKLHSSFWDEIMLHIRSRWKMIIIPQDKAVRYLLDKDHRPWSFGFIADQRPRNANTENWIEFLNHDTTFITGPEDIGDRTDASFFYLDMKRPKRGYYKVTFKELKGLNDVKPYPITREFYQEFQKTIESNPSLWLWSHRRWAYHRRKKQE